jgi:hypothetical protein
MEEIFCEAALTIWRFSSCFCLVTNPIPDSSNIQYKVAHQAFPQMDKSADCRVLTQHIDDTYSAVHILLEYARDMDECKHVVL